MQLKSAMVFRECKPQQNQELELANGASLLGEPADFDRRVAPDGELAE
jgi:hypothetical protein